MKAIRIRRRKKLDTARDGQQSFIKKKADEAEFEETSRRGSFFKGKSNTEVQEKLKISQPGDKSEVQADEMANQVVSRQDSEEEEVEAKLHKQEEEEEEAQPKRQDKLYRQEEEEEEAQPKRQESLSRQEEEEEVQEKLNKQEEEEDMQAKLHKQEKEEEEVQTKSTIFRKENNETTRSFDNRLEAAKQGGSPLPESLRKEMEKQFSTGLSHVRVHTDKQAIKLCNEINAQAFTKGNHIFFNKGKYRPETTAGKQLLAHELTHVVQQK
ncbi:MAG: DUF4157 domain-containing protein [Bacteroidales bacterium]|nr:DUF4157 domain-containing protein [Bacteroidales bacterium]